MNQKTEQPTRRRLERARREGDHPVSRELTAALGFGVAVLLIPAALFFAVERLLVLVREAFVSPVPASWESATGHVLLIAVPLLAAAAAATLTVGLAQTRASFSPSRWALDWTRLAQGFGSGRGHASLRALIAALLVFAAAGLVLQSHASDISATTGDLTRAVPLAKHLALTLLRLTAGIALGLAGLDLVLARRAWLERLMMSRREIEQERRETEGDPALGAARRRAHQELLDAAELDLVAHARVIISDGATLAVALRYSPEQSGAPTVLLQGRGELARQAIAKAQSSFVAIVSDPALARALSTIAEGSEIPEQHYEAVADVWRSLTPRRP